jgi:predicted nucleotidyltransferase
MVEDRAPVRFHELLRSLVERDVAFIVVGGVAAVLEGAPVSTFDLDVVYALEESNIDRLAGALEELDAVYVDPGGRNISPTAERLRGGGHHLLRTRHGRLDVMGSVGDELAFPDLLPRSRTQTVHGLEIVVLTLEALIATKESADRPKDRAVLDLLRETLAQRNRKSGD